MVRWTPDLDRLIVELAADGLSARAITQVLEPHRATIPAVQSRARRLGVRFISITARPLRAYLISGATLLREEIGGSVGVRWTTATRTGRTFPAQLCERLRERGELIEARVPGAYRWSDASTSGSALH